MEVLYAALSSMLYFNETWLGYALEPLLRAQDGKGVGYAAPDLGDAYPTATFDTSKLNATRAIEGMRLKHSLAKASSISRFWKHADHGMGACQVQQ